MSLNLVLLLATRLAEYFKQRCTHGPCIQTFVLLLGLIKLSTVVGELVAFHDWLFGIEFFRSESKSIHYTYLRNSGYDLAENN